MTPLPAGRRRAERFATLVDGPVGDGVDAADLELLELVGALRAVPEAQPRPEFSADLRSRLMEAAAAADRPRVESTPDRAVSDRLTVTPRRRPRERRLAVAVGALAIVGATTSMAVASQSALPGDALYPLKRAIEDTHTSLSVGDEAKGTTVLHNASDRLTEARDLSRNGSDADRVTSTLHTFTAQAEQGSTLLTEDYQDHGDTASINQIRDFAVDSIAKLDELDGLVPDGSRPALVDAAKQVFLIDAAAGQLCPACSSTGITQMPGSLLSSSSLTQPVPALPTSGPTDGPQATATRGPQSVPSGVVSIAPSLIATARPTPVGSASAAPTGAPTGAPSTAAAPTSAASSTGLLGGVLGGVTGGGGGKSKTPSPIVNPSAAVSGASAAVSSVASAVGGVVSAAASGVGTVLGGLLGNGQGTP